MTHTNKKEQKYKFINYLTQLKILCILINLRLITLNGEKSMRDNIKN